MKTKNILVAAALMAVTIGACKKANSYVDTFSEGTTTVNGEVSGVWQKGSTQLIKGDIIIPAGKSLTIEEGVTIIMDTLAKPEFIVKGNLYSMGTAEFPVKFTVSESLRTAKHKFGKLWGGILAAPSCEELLRRLYNI
jgi:hypothetical protein